MEKKIKEPIMMPPMKEQIPHDNLELLSESNGMTLLRSSKSGKIYAVVKSTSVFGLGFYLEELTSLK